MKPIKTEGSNVKLVLEEEKHLPEEQQRGTLHAERMLFQDEETGDQKPGFESVWEPTDGERKALSNGAPITLRLWGAHHPIVNMLVGDVPEGEVLHALVTVEQTREAAGKFFERLSVRMAEVEEGGEPIETREIGAMFNLALEDVLRNRPERPSANGSAPEA